MSPQDLPHDLPVILMADDSRDDCNLVERALKRLDFPCTFSTVADGAALLTRLNAQARPALILLDLNMPIKSGFEALKEIKSDPQLRSIPVVIWSTSQSMADVKETYDLGTNAYLSKPDTFADLVESMRSLVKFWFQSSTLPQTLADRPNQ